MPSRIGRPPGLTTNRGTGPSVVLRFAQAEEGIAILEFALIAPILLLLYFGTVELSNVMRHARKLDILSRTLGDTLSLRTAPTAAEVEGIFRAVPVVLAPFAESDLRMTVSAVGVSGDGETGPLRVCSSVAASGSPVRIAGMPAPVDEADSVQVVGTRLLLVEIAMTYRPVAGGAFFKDGAGFTLSRKSLWPVRYGRRYASQSPEIVLPNGVACLPR